MAGKLDFSGLDSFSALLKNPQASEAGAPMAIAVDLIELDPNQPRKSVDQAKVEEMAISIEKRGLLQPISVRPNPDKPGHYLINFGERRWRAHQHLGRAEIEARIQDKAGAGLRADQLVENIQREDLSMRDIVAGIATMKAAGMKQTDIAGELGKSKAWVSKHAALLDLPEPLAKLLEDGRARDASTLYEALQCYKTDEAATLQFLEVLGDRQLVQSDVERLRALITRPKNLEQADAPAAQSMTAGNAAATSESEDAPETPSTSPSEQGGETAPTLPADGQASHTTAQDGGTAGSESETANGEPSDGEQGRNQNVQQRSTPDPDKYRKPLVQVRVGRREGVMLVNKRAEYGLVWVQFEDGEDQVLDVSKVKVVAITDGTKSAG